MINEQELVEILDIVWKYCSNKININNKNIVKEVYGRIKKVAENCQYLVTIDNEDFLIPSINTNQTFYIGDIVIIQYTTSLAEGRIIGLKIN